MISMLKTSTGFLQSQIDSVVNCCTQIEALESCCESLASEIEQLICPLSDDCCKAQSFTAADVTNDVETGDWSHDNKYIAIGLDNSLDPNDGDVVDPFVLKIYELVGSNLVLRAQSTVGVEVGEVTVVRWHPTKYRLAVGRKNTSDSDENKLHIFDFNPNTNALTQTDSAETVDVYAVAWNPKSVTDSSDSSDEEASVLAVGRDLSTGQLILYTVSPNGLLTAASSSVDTDGTVSTKALDWDKHGLYLVVGLKLNATNKALKVYKFSPHSLSLQLNAQTDVESGPCDPTTKSTVMAVDWNHDLNHLIAVGLKGKNGQLAQVFEHNPIAHSLTYACGIDSLGRSVRSLDWRDGSCLALGKSGGPLSGGEFRIYAFNANKCSFDLSSEFDDFENKDVQEVRWSPNGSFILNGSDVNRLSVYKANSCKRITLCDVISIIEELESCCDINTSMIDMLKTSTGFLQSEIDFCCSMTTSNNFVSIISRIEILETCCDALRTSTGFLQSEIDFCCSMTNMSENLTIISIIDQLESCCDALRTSTGFLQSQIDACCSNVESCCDALKTSTGFLQSQIDFCCSMTNMSENLTIISIIDQLESCCDALRTSTGFLQSQIDACCSNVESCCDALKTSTGFLQSQIDVCCNTLTPTLQDCIITVTGDLFLTPDLLPANDTATVFRFTPCYGRMCGDCPQTPRVIIDPAVFGSNRIPLNKNTRIIFQGEGLVENRNGVVWDYMGTPFSDMADWPALIIEDKARMTFCPGATVIFGGGNDEGTTGAGKFIVRQAGQMLVVDPSVHVIFGETFNTQILQIVEADGLVAVGKIENGEDHPSTPMPTLSYILGTFDLEFRNHATLNINNGIFELNTDSSASLTPWLTSNYTPGIINSITFSQGSSLQIVKTGDPAVQGLLRLAPNDGDTPVRFDNRASTIFTNDAAALAGNIQFRNADGTVRTTLLIQNNSFAIQQSMLTIFNELTYIVPRGIAEVPQSTILARLGDIDNLVSNGLVVPGQNGRLTGYCQMRDGSIVQLCQGDQNVTYDFDPITNTTVLKGIDSLGRTWIIRNCDASTRTPAPINCGF